MIEEYKKKNKILQEELKNGLKDQKRTVPFSDRNAGHRKISPISKPSLLIGDTEKNEVKKDLKEAENLIGILKKELDLAEIQIKDHDKIIEMLKQKLGIKNLDDLKSNRNLNSTTVKKLERDVENLSQKLIILEKDKKDLVKELNLYKEELYKQEEFFLNEIENNKTVHSTTVHDHKSVDDLMGRLNKFQEAFKIERLKSRKEIDNGMLIAKERVKVLEEELKKESDFMDNEVGSLKNEIEE